MHTRTAQQGFSLLELLVVLMVVVLITSMVTLTVSSGGQDIRLEAEVRNLVDVASYALDEAQMTGQDYGLLLQQESEEGELVFVYDWRVRELDGWAAPPVQMELFAPVRLPPGLVLEMELEDTPIIEVSLDEEAPTSPQIVLYASGEVTVGAIELRKQDTGDVLWRIEWDLLGRFTLLPRGEPEPDEEL